MFDSEDEDQPENQFDAVTRYQEPDEAEAESIGPDVPEAPDPTDPDVDVDGDLLVSFWRLVVIFNIALLVTSLGLMFAFLEGDLTLGGQLTIAGLAVFAYGVFRYRRARSTVVEDARTADDSVGDTDPGDQNG
ncbi:hypothetical protein ACKVMT_00830 [Halobacteriales archaeon Cl-PHB]